MSMYRSRYPSKQSRQLGPGPELCAQLLGEHIQAARLNDGRSVDQIAPWAGLTGPEWEAIECGQAPDSWEHVCLMAAALKMGPKWKTLLANLYIGAKKG